MRPLDAVGRAAGPLAAARPDEIELGVGYLDALRLRALLAGELEIRVDLTPRVLLAARPERVFADTNAFEKKGPRLLADLVSPLVLEPDGTLVPLQYGYPRSFAIGNLGRARFNLLASMWKKRSHGAFRRVCRSAHQRVSREGAPPLAHWYWAATEEALAAEDEAARAPVHPPPGRARPRARLIEALFDDWKRLAHFAFAFMARPWRARGPAR